MSIYAARASFLRSVLPQLSSLLGPGNRVVASYAVELARLERGADVVAPASCSSCEPERPCLSHVCPDCGSPTSGALSSSGELAHRCPV